MGNAMRRSVWTAVLLSQLALGGCVAQAPRQVLLDGQLVIEGVPEVPIEVLGELRRYQFTRSAQLLGWLDEGILISTRFANTAQLHRVREPLGMREQVTFQAEPVYAASVSPVPDSGGFVYSKDVGGSEFFQLFWFDLATGGSRLLTDGNSRYTDIVWGPSGRTFAYTTTERNGTDWDLHAQSLDGDRRVLLEGRGVGWTALDWSPDEGRVLATQYRSATRGTLHEIDVHSGRIVELLDPALEVAVHEAHYGAGGDAVYFTSDLGAEFIRLHRLDRRSGRIELVTGDIPWDVEAFEVAPDGSRLAMVINEDGYSRLYVMRLEDHGFVALPELPVGVVQQLAFSPGGGEIGFVVNRATAPADVYSVDLGRRVLKRWTQSELGGLRPEEVADAQLVRYPTFDGREIPAFVYRPSTPAPHPVLISIHGGPHAQYRPRFSYTTQFFVNALGITVIAPNVRGSSGYGTRYIELDDGPLREDSVRDIGALLDWIEAQPDLDASRVAVMGGSYGGYMVLASLIRYGARLKAGVERVGISNFVTFLENTQPYRQDLRRVEYGDERDPATRRFLEAISPLTHADRIESPLLISQGYNDPRVPASESEQLVAALRRNDVPVWYVLAMNEGHGFRRKINVDVLVTVTAYFLQRFLVGDARGSAGASWGAG